ncbi:Uncharacterised protein [Yersinia enterocolitica]|nr:Uncharacterised protein [Yersinia enterocolitica]
MPNHTGNVINGSAKTLTKNFNQGLSFLKLIAYLDDNEA